MGQWLGCSLLGNCSSADAKAGGFKEGEELYTDWTASGKLETAIEDVSQAVDVVEELERRHSSVPASLKAGAARAKQLLQPARKAIEGFRSSQCGALDCCGCKEEVLHQRFEELKQWKDQWVFDLNEAQLALNVGKLGQQKSEGRDYEGALDVFSEALKKTPTDTFLLGQRGRVFMHRRQDAEAKEDFQGVLRSEPDDVFAKCFLLLMQAQELYDLVEVKGVRDGKKEVNGQQELEESANLVDTSEDALKEENGCSSPSLEGLAPSAPEPVAEEAVAALDSEARAQLEELQRLVEEALQALPPHEEGRDVDELRARGHLLRAKALLCPVGREPDRALEDLNAALALRPRLTEARSLRSSLCEELGMLDLKHWNEVIEAEEDYDGLRRLRGLRDPDDPSNADALMGRSKLLMERGELQSALADIDRALEATPAGLEGLLASADVKQSLMKLPEALEDCFKAYDLQPANAEVAARIAALRELMRGMEDASLCSEHSSAPLLTSLKRGPSLRASLRSALSALRPKRGRVAVQAA